MGGKCGLVRNKLIIGLVDEDSEVTPVKCGVCAKQQTSSFTLKTPGHRSGFEITRQVQLARGLVFETTGCRRSFVSR